MTRVSLNAIPAILFAMATVSFATLAPTSPLKAATLVLSGSVAANCTVSITEFNSPQSLDLGVAQTDLKVAEVTERCNDKDGYTVTVRSANAFTASSSQARLESADDPEVVDYTLEYDAVAVAFTNGDSTVTDSNSKTGGTGITKDLTLTYLVNANLASDTTYTDTLTVTLAAK